MRICLVNEFFEPHITGGTELFLDHLVDYLSSRGFRIDIITGLFKGDKEYEHDKNISIHRINSSPISIGHFKQLPGVTLPFNFFNFALQKRLIKIMRKCDCVHINNLYHLSFSPIQLANRLGKFVLLDVHDYWPVCFKKNLFYLNKNFCGKKSSFKCIKCLMSTNAISTISYPFLSSLVISEYFLRNRSLQLDDIITHSRFMGEIIEREFKVKPKVINYPYFGKKIINKRRVIKDQINLLFIGRVEVLKGAHFLLPIAKILKNKGISYNINVIGSGNIINELKSQSERAGLNIKFYGFVGHMSQKFINIMKESHILLAPSLWHEPFGIVILEAMGFGIPVITSNRGGIKEIVKQNDVGVIVPPNPKNIAKKVELFVNDHKMYKKFSSNAIKNIKRYRPERVFKKYEKIFEKSCN